MKQTLVGTFPLGYLNVDLYALPETSAGYFYLRPDSTSRPRIKIGVQMERWDECVSVLLHETMEMLLALHGCRFRECGHDHGDHASYRFFYSHEQFTKLCQFQAWFLTPALPEMAKHWGKAHPYKGKGSGA